MSRSMKAEFRRAVNARFDRRAGCARASQSGLFRQSFAAAPSRAASK
jgi:hypothetical protein